MATNKPQDDYQKQGVRIPKTLHTRIHEAAVTSGRSYNSELIARLESSFTPQTSDREVDWDLRAARHTSEVRLETTSAHLMMVEMHLENLKQRRELMSREGVAKQELDQVAAALETALKERQRLLDQKQAHMAEYLELQGQYDKATSRVTEQLDDAADIALQGDYREIRAREDKLKSPEEGRTVVIVPPKRPGPGKKSS